MHVLRVLGTVDVADAAGDWRRAGPAKQTCVLAALALSPGSPLPVAELTARVWGADAPLSAPNVLYGHMTRLRALLRDTGRAVTVIRDDDGYRLDAEPDSIDVFAMRALASRAQDQVGAGDLDAASRLWREAAGLWRGQPLLGVAGDWAGRTRKDLTREHTSVLSGHFETELALGNHAAIVGDLYQALGRDPTAEALVGHLMLALYRCDRPAEALACFEEARVRLRDRLGTEPAQRLQRLHRQILNHDPALTATAPPRGAIAPRTESAPSAEAATVPLMRPPAAPTAFTGRAEAIELLTAHATAARDDPDPGTIGVTVVDGMAGIGKTALAVAVAHRLAAEYPDGCMFIDLHGFTADLDPVPPAAALERLLRALGVAAAAMPEDPDDRAAAYRGALAGRRVLIVLDNAADARQVRPLLPGAAGAYVIVTSRNRLTGLDEARSLPLDPLGAEAAAELFTRVCGREPAGTARDRRESAETEAARQNPGPDGAEPPEIGTAPRDSDDTERVQRIAELCGRLPLALRIAAARFRSRPHWSLADFEERLSRRTRPLAELDLGERGVTAAFQTSYRELDPEHRRAFRLLALSVGPDFGVPAAAALLDTDLVTAETLLEHLLDTHLLRADTVGRYRFHDLLRRYAADVVHAEETPADRQAALTRLLDLYRHTAHRAGKLLAPNLRPPAAPEPATAAIELADREAAAAWFTAERPDLTEALNTAIHYGRHDHAWQIAIGLNAHLNGHGSYADILDSARLGASAAEQSGDQAAQAVLLTQLGGAHRMLNHFTEAGELFEQALRLHRDAADHHGEAMALNNLGLLRQRQGRFTDSVADFQRALSLIESDPGLSAMVRTNLGIPLQHLGQAATALEHYRTASRLYRELGNDTGAAVATSNIGGALWLLGDVGAALEHHRRALEYFRRNRMRHLVAIVHNAMGCDLRCLGHIDEALDVHQLALRGFRELNDRHNEGNALVELGRTHLAADSPAAARDHFADAAAVTAAIDSPYQAARAHHGLADAWTALGDNDTARTHLDTAIDGYDACRTPEAETLRGRRAEPHPS